MFTKIIAGLLFLIVLAVAIRHLPRKKTVPALPEPEPVYVSADICDAYIPLLDEGIAAATALREQYKAARRVELDFQIKEFEALRGRAQSRLLQMAPYSLSLDRKYEFDGDGAVGRFKRAIEAIDSFHDKNLMLPRNV
ncbi:MAG: hypothetical protein ACAH80_02310 [Alphaproteobacteria bacterium]